MSYGSILYGASDVPLYGASGGLLYGGLVWIGNYYQDRGIAGYYASTNDSQVESVWLADQVSCWAHYRAQTVFSSITGGYACGCSKDRYGDVLRMTAIERRYPITIPSGIRGNITRILAKRSPSVGATPFAKKTATYPSHPPADVDEVWDGGMKAILKFANASDAFPTAGDLIDATPDLSIDYSVLNTWTAPTDEMWFEVSADAVACLNNAASDDVYVHLAVDATDTVFPWFANGQCAILDYAQGHPFSGDVYFAFITD